MAPAANAMTRHIILGQWGWQPDYLREGRIFAHYLLAHRPTGKIGILFDKDDAGRDAVRGLKDGLNDQARSLQKCQMRSWSRFSTRHTISLKAAGADIFNDATSAKFAARSIKCRELDG